MGSIQRRLAWPLRKDDMHKARSVNSFFQWKKDGARVVSYLGFVGKGCVRFTFTLSPRAPWFLLPRASPGKLDISSLAVCRLVVWSSGRLVVLGPRRLVVRMSRCGCDNPGSIPGVDNHCSSRPRQLQLLPPYHDWASVSRKRRQTSLPSNMRAYTYPPVTVGGTPGRYKNLFERQSLCLAATTNLWGT